MPNKRTFTDAIKFIQNHITQTPKGCWQWTKKPNVEGYGYICVSGKRLATHRVMWMHAFGAIPVDKVIDHICRNRACCNPDHLRLVTDRENILIGDGPPAKNARKTHCVKGHPYDEVNTEWYTSTTGKRRRQCWTCRHTPKPKHLWKMRATKTHCKHGHEFTKENTYWRKPMGNRKAATRMCRRCHADSELRRRNR